MANVWSLYIAKGITNIWNTIPAVPLSCDTQHFAMSQDYCEQLDCFALAWPQFSYCPKHLVGSNEYTDHFGKHLG